MQIYKNHQIKDKKVFYFNYAKHTMSFLMVIILYHLIVLFRLHQFFINSMNIVDTKDIKNKDRD